LQTVSVSKDGGAYVDHACGVALDPALLAGHKVGVGTSIKVLVEMIRSISMSSLKIEYKEAEEEFVTDRLGSIAKANDDLNFLCTVGLSEGLGKVIEWRALN